MGCTEDEDEEYLLVVFLLRCLWSNWPDFRMLALIFALEQEMEKWHVTGNGKPVLTGNGKLVGFGCAVWFGW